MLTGFLLGLLAGVVFGIILGCIVGYGMGRDAGLWTDVPRQSCQRCGGGSDEYYNTTGRLRDAPCPGCNGSGSRKEHRHS